MSHSPGPAVTGMPLPNGPDTGRRRAGRLDRRAAAPMSATLIYSLGLVYSASMLTLIGPLAS